MSRESMLEQAKRTARGFETMATGAKKGPVAACANELATAIKQLRKCPPTGLPGSGVPTELSKSRGDLFEAVVQKAARLSVSDDPLCRIGAEAIATSILTVVIQAEA